MGDKIYSFIRMIFFLINALLIVFGMFLIAVGGALVQWTIKDYVNGQYEPKVIHTLETAYKANMTGSNPVTASQISSAAMELLNPLTFYLIIVGGALALIAMVGIIGIARDSQVVTFLYVTLFTVAAVVGLYFLTMYIVIKPPPDKFKSTNTTVHKYYQGFALDFMKDSLKDYAGWTRESGISILWNFFMIRFGCCGAVNGQDFQKLRKWPKAAILHNLNFTQVPIAAPVACCATLGGYRQLDLANVKCPEVFDDRDNVDKGCIISFWDEVKKNFETYIWIAGFIIFPALFICGLMAIYLIYVQKKRITKKPPSNMKMSLPRIMKFPQVLPSKNDGYFSKRPPPAPVVPESDLRKRRFYIIKENLLEATDVTIDALRELPMAIWKGLSAGYNTLNPHPEGFTYPEPRRRVRNYAVERMERDERRMRRDHEDRAWHEYVYGYSY